MKKILLITSCTGTKKYKDKDEIYAGDVFYRNVNHNFDLKERNLKNKGYCCQAYDMYIGHQYGENKEKDYGPVRKAVSLLRKCNLNLDHYILSAGFGLIPSTKEIVPYDISFTYPNKQNKKFTDIRLQTTCKNKQEWADFLKIKSNFNELISQYDLIIILLASDYTKILNLKKELFLRDNQKLLYFDNKNNNLPKEKDNFLIIDPSDFKNENYDKPGSLYNYKIRGHLLNHLVQCTISQKKSFDDYIYKSTKSQLYKDLKTIKYSK